MSKYNRLRDYLHRVRLNTFPMTFQEIESILDFSLPPSAHEYQAWWSGESHALAKAVMHAGFRASFSGSDFMSRKVTFRRIL